MNLKVVSYNIWYGQYLDKVIKFLQSANADIIGLQEVVQQKDGSENTAETIANKLGYNFVFAPAIEIERNGKIVDWGNAILTKYNIDSNKVHVLSEVDKRIALKVDLTVENKKLHIFSTHLVHAHQKPSSVQDEQAENLVHVLPKNNTILMGDFNALPTSNSVRTVSKVLNGTDESFSPTWSVYPDGCVICKPQGVEYRLDYIFTSHDIKTSSPKVELSQGSDHLPISAIAEI